MYSILTVGKSMAEAENSARQVSLTGCEDWKVYTAGGGQEALRLAEELAPDAVLTELSMPNMDGLKLIRRLQDKKLCRYFILTGEELKTASAMQAMHLGIRHFLPAPMETDALEATLREIERDIQSEAVFEARKTAAQKVYMNEVFRDHLEGRGTEKFPCWQIEAREMGFSLNASGYICITCVYSASVGDVMHREIMVACEGSELLRGALGVRIKDEQTTLVLSMQKETTAEQVTKAAEELQRQVLTHRPEDRLTIGIGRKVKGFEWLPESYQSSAMVVSYRLTRGNESVMDYDAFRDKMPVMPPNAPEIFQQLSDAMANWDIRRAEEIVHAVFDDIRCQQEMSITDLRVISLQMLLCGARQIPVDQLEVEQYVGQSVFLMQNLDQLSNLEELEDYLCRSLKSINQIRAMNQIQVKTDPVEEAKNYIRNHLGDNISLNLIADRLFINPAYFSQLFKRKTGMKYQDYLTDLRVEKAKCLLETTDNTLSDICRATGYTDLYYFTKVFQKKTGEKPNQYRRRCGRKKI